MHFALAVVIDPLACLDEDSGKKTSVLYFDSSKERDPLAGCEHFAMAAMEWDAIQCQKEPGELVDVALISAVASRISFQTVKVSLSCGLTDSV